MAIRNVDTDLWNDAKISETFTSDDLLFWLFLLTTRYSNFAGCFQITPRQMQIDLKFANVEKVEKLIERFANEHELIAYDYETHEIIIFNWLKYNVNTSQSHRTSVEKHAEKIKNQSFKQAIYDILDGGHIGGVVGACRGLKDNNKDNIKDNIKVETKAKEKDKDKKPYGDFKRVLLTDDEFEKLKKWFLLYYEAYIEKLDLYIASKGVKYKSHYATLRQWLNRDGKVPEEISIAEFDEEGNLINE